MDEFQDSIFFFDAIQFSSRTEQSIEAINRQPPKEVRLNNCGTPKSETGGVFPSGRAGGCRVWTMWTGGCRARQTVLRAEIAYVCKLTWYVERVKESVWRKRTAY